MQAETSKSRHLGVGLFPRAAVLKDHKLIIYRYVQSFWHCNMMMSFTTFMFGNYAIKFQKKKKNLIS